MLSDLSQFWREADPSVTILSNIEIRKIVRGWEIFTVLEKKTECSYLELIAYENVFHFTLAYTSLQRLLNLGHV